MAVAIIEQAPALLSNRHPLWHRTAPRRLVEKQQTGGLLGGWKAWQEHLARRERPTPPPFFVGKQPPLLWGWPNEWQREATEAVLRSQAQVADVALSAGPTLGFDLSQALQAVALAYALPELAGTLTAEPWWQLVERLHELANEAQQHRVDWPGDPGNVVRQQLLAGELPLALGYLLPEVRVLRALRKTARTALSEALLALTDGEGLPHARLLPVLGPLFACWTRTRWLGESLKRGAWSRAANVQYQWLVRQAIRLASRDGNFVLTPRDQSSTAAWTTPLFSMALELVGDDGDCAAANVALPGRVVPKHIAFDPNDLPKPSLNSDWSAISVLATGWSRSAVRLAVAFADEPVSIELNASGEQLLTGAWTFDTKCDGEPVEVVGDWEQLCWESDKHCDFLELGVALSSDLRLERQFLLARDDRVLFLADIVHSADGTPRHIQHSFGLPLGPCVTWWPEADTRDGVLLGDKHRLAVLPLALHEWRIDPRGGNLTGRGRSLTLTQETSGSAMCCPLLIDLKPRRARKQRTWRQLTVGESLEVVPRDTAVAYRAQSGRDQWLFYRSLGQAGNRTVLGQNIAGEFSAGPFLPTGKYKEWIEIEAV